MKQLLNFTLENLKWPSLKATLHWLRTSNGVVYALLPVGMLLAFWMVFGYQFALIRFWLFAIVASTLFFVVRELKSTFAAKCSVAVFLLINSLVIFFPFRNEAKVDMIGWKPLVGVKEIRAEIPLFPRSEKWKEIRENKDARTYLYFSMSRIQPFNEVSLSINGNKYENFQDMEGVTLSTTNGGYALPLDWSEIDGRDTISVRFKFENTKDLTFFSSFYEQSASTMGKQEVCIKQGCFLSAKYFDGVSLVIEVRIADAYQRVFGVLH